MAYPYRFQFDRCFSLLCRYLFVVSEDTSAHLFKETLLHIFTLTAIINNTQSRIHPSTPATIPIKTFNSCGSNATPIPIRTHIKTTSGVTQSPLPQIFVRFRILLLSYLKRALNVLIYFPFAYSALPLLFVHPLTPYFIHILKSKAKHENPNTINSTIFISPSSELSLTVFKLVNCFS